MESGLPCLDDRPKAVPSMRVRLQVEPAQGTREVVGVHARLLPRSWSRAERGSGREHRIAGWRAARYGGTSAPTPVPSVLHSRHVEPEALCEGTGRASWTGPSPENLTHGPPRLSSQEGRRTGLAYADAGPGPLTVVRCLPALDPVELGGSDVRFAVSEEGQAGRTTAPCSHDVPPASEGSSIHIISQTTNWAIRPPECCRTGTVRKPPFAD